MSDGMSRSELEAVVGQTWNSSELQLDFDCGKAGFSYGVITNISARVDLDNGLPAGTVVSLEFGDFWTDDSKTSAGRLYYKAVQMGSSRW